MNKIPVFYVNGLFTLFGFVQMNLNRHYYTLVHIARECSELLKGYILIECFSQEKNVLVFQFQKSNHILTLECSLENENGGIWLRENYNRAKKNTADIFPEIIGMEFKGCFLHPTDRIVILQFNAATVYCILFGGARSTILCCNSQGIILNVFKKRNWLAGMEYFPETDILPVFTEMPDTLTMYQALSRCSLLLGKIYAMHILQIAEIEPNILLKNIDISQKQYIYTLASEFREQCLRTTQFFLISNGRDEFISLLPLHNYPIVKQVFTSLSQALQRHSAMVKSNATATNARKKILAEIEEQLSGLEKSIYELENEQKGVSRSALYTQYAQALMSADASLRLKEKEISINGPDSVPLTIPVDPMLTVIQNAELYFRKARHSRESAMIRREKLPAMIRQRSDLLELRQALADVYTSKEINKLWQNYQQKSARHKKHSQTSSSEQQRFRVFDLSGGYILYVGKNAVNNDELTLRFARPDDIWMHARGVSGSHAILKGGKKPPRSVLEKAAAIAAWFSQARNATYTPVSWTYKKYIRKPRGANPGAVIMEREEVVMVKPQLPADALQEF
jgi:predicted ribosome quality control (RQC) complex YloA/Tae2 family protein